MSKNINTIIEITDSHIKCIQFKQAGGKHQVVSCDLKSIDGYSDDDIIRELKHIIPEKNIDSGSVFCVVPRRHVVLKTLMLPSQNQHELYKMTELQLVDKIPYNLDEVNYSIQAIEKHSTGYTKILAIVVHQDVSERYLKTFSQIGVKLHHLTLSSVGLLGWVLSLDKKNQPVGNSPCLLINIDVLHTEICFVHRHRLIYSRNITIGARDVNKNAGDPLVSQIDLSVKAYEQEDMGPKLERMIIISSIPDVKILSDSLGRNYNIPVDVIDPLDQADLKPDNQLKVVQDHPGMSLAVVLGLKTKLARSLINLAPPKVAVDKKEKHKKKQVISLVLLVFLSFILFSGIFMIDVHIKKDRLEEIRDIYAQIKRKANKATQRIDFVKMLNNKIENRVFIPDVIDELHSIIPTETSIYMLNINDKGTVVIQGYTIEGRNVNQFQEMLLKSPVFDEVNLLFATVRRVYNQDVTDYKFECRLTSRNTKDD